MKNTTIQSTTTVVRNAGAAKRFFSVAWQVTRRMGVLCWAIAVAVINLGDA
ncbi:hypothetical protein [Cerasicoccus frondis]|uniref:hypothetical protein n=1 Tax=Cerasicoccus frondis TaxID=490090 RepID=UPI002852A1E5|nr:hypothetical protein [Cerasicoccus frondis]